MRKSSTVSRTKNRRVASGQMRLELKQKLHTAGRDMTAALLVFLLLLALSLAFLLYQWKEYLLTRYTREIQMLTEEIYRLRSKNNYLEGELKRKYASYHRIARISRQKLGFQEATQPPSVLTVDGKKLKAFAQKDEKEY